MGGDEGVEATVAAFYERVFADPTLRPFFDDVSLEKLMSMQREFFAAALGGPVEYSGMSLRTAHDRLAITSRELSLFTEHLLATLECTELGRTAVTTIVSRIALFGEDLLHDVSEDG